MVCDIVTENLIKGIIVAHSKTGITINEIANVFHNITGEHWPYLIYNGLTPSQYLQQIDGILSYDNEMNETLWYVRGKVLGENRGKIHRSKNQSISASSNQSTWQQPHGSRSNTCNQYNNGNTNNFGRTTKHNTNTDHNNNGYTVHNANYINGNYASRNSKQQRFYKSNAIDVNGHQRDTVSTNGTDARNSPGGNCAKTTAFLYDYDLVGDDFLLELAKIDLDCSSVSRKRIQQSGLCISGQNIRDATERIRRYPDTKNMKLIINVGSIDLLHGADLTDMIQDYTELIKTCDRRRIKPVITTLAPLANRRHDPIENKKFDQFNEFLVNKFADKIPVIDITPCLINKVNGRLLFGCYQPTPKYMSGSSQPHTLWNRIGRQRILKQIKANLPITLA